MRLGIYGGTFSPPHNGHVEAAEAFCREMRLDKLLIIPTFVPPHKITSDDATPEQRLEMCKLAFSHIPCAEISNMEIRRGGKSYTYLTLEELSGDGVELFFLCGTDMILTFDEWKRYEYIFSLATICYARRENYDQNTRKIEEKIRQYQKLGAKIIEIDHKVNEISSTEIRSLLISRRDNKTLDRSVFDYIVKTGIYMSSDFSQELIDRVRALISERRFNHTLGVVRASEHIARSIDPALVVKAKHAALLHDVTKEMNQDSLISSYNIALTDDDKKSPETLHALTAVPYISENFPGFAAGDILTAIKTHTTGDENMSILSKILFVADYVEEGRRYPSSAELRNALYSELAASRNKEEALVALDRAVVASIDFTLTHLESCGKFIHPKTRLTKEAILNKIEDKQRK